MTTRDSIADFSSNEGQDDALFAKLFDVYHDLMLIMNNSIQHVIFGRRDLKSLSCYSKSGSLKHKSIHFFVGLLKFYFQRSTILIL